MRRQPGRPEHLILNHLPFLIGQWDRADTPDQIIESGRIETDLIGTVDPTRPQRPDPRVDLFRAASIKRSDHRSLRRVLTADRHPFLNLDTPSRERPQHMIRNAGDVGNPVRDLTPLDTEVDRQVVTQLRFIQIADRLR
jgi:hypothetical protein